MLLVTPQREPALGELLLDLVDALLAEIRDVEQLGLGLADQVADGLDSLALEAVVRTHAELELFDEHVVHAAARRRRRETLDRVPVSYTHLRAHETRHDLVCRLLLEKKKKRITI